jgi:hypothetical protein
MQLAVRVGDQLLGALVDSDSTHSFISVTAASQLHLDPLPLPGLRVKVANDDHVATAGICCKTWIFIDSEEFVIDLFVIPLDGYDMVLGVHWLLHAGADLVGFHTWQHELLARRPPRRVAGHGRAPHHADCACHGGY